MPKFIEIKNDADRVCIVNIDLIQAVTHDSDNKRRVILAGQNANLLTVRKDEADRLTKLLLAYAGGLL